MVHLKAAYILPGKQGVEHMPITKSQHIELYNSMILRTLTPGFGSRPRGQNTPGVIPSWVAVAGC